MRVTVLLLCLIFVNLTYAQLFGPSTVPPRKDREFQTRRYRCLYELEPGMQKKCMCIIKVVKKKTGNLFKNLGCEIFRPVDDLMMEVHAVYNFTTVNVLNTELFGNTCPIGTDEQFMQFAQLVKDFSLNLAQPCLIPGRFESVDADFDAGLIEAVSPILPTGDYNAYVRVFQANENKTLAFQTLYGSTPFFDPSSIPILNSIMNFFG